VKPEDELHSFFAKKLSVLKSKKKEIPSPVYLPPLDLDTAQRLPHIAPRQPFQKFFDESLEDVFSDLQASTKERFREMYFRRRKAVLGY
jgi:hypothetical protein